MTKEQIDAEVMFHASIAPYVKMMKEGIITAEDLAVICTILEGRYSPIFVGYIVSN